MTDLNAKLPSTAKIVKQLKNDGQDFEWYPTTSEMMKAVAEDIIQCNFAGDKHSFLDIGCGDGRVLRFIRQYTYSNSIRANNHLPFQEVFGIEKSETHLKSLIKSDIPVIGTDFWETRLMDKNVSVIFCNPPYSEYAQWVENILTNGYALSFYFVIPERWVDNKGIESALKRRNLRADVIYQGDFLNGERSARAKINIVRVAPNRFYRSFNSFRSSDDKGLDYPNFSHTYYSNSADDPFNDWFNDVFKFDLDKNTLEKEKSNDEACRAVFAKSNGIQELADWYNKDLSEIQKNYDSLSLLDPVLFKELGINLDNLKEAVCNRFSSLKNRYWNNFIDFYEPIRSRLTKEKREELKFKLVSQTRALDFTVKNMLYVTELVIERANDYFNEQIVAFYKKLADLENIKMYKSNQKVFATNYDWRYNRENTPYKLECRIITTGVSQSYFTPSLQDMDDRLNDICIILRSIGFNVDLQKHSYDDKIPFGQSLEYLEHNMTTNKKETAFEVKFFKNGNCHIKFRKDIMLALNVVAGRLLGWVTTPEQASEEMGESLSDIQANWNKTDALKLTNKSTLIGLPNFE